MDIKKAVAICKEMQKWGRAEGVYSPDSSSAKPMPYSPREFGEAIDVLIKEAEK